MRGANEGWRRGLAGVGGFGDGGAGADEVAVAMDVVDAGHRWPVFGSSHPGAGESGGLAGVGVWPFAGGDLVGGVRSVLERIVLGIGDTGFDGFDLSADGDHGVDEAIQFGFGFALRGLDHERAADGP